MMKKFGGCQRAVSYPANSWRQRGPAQLRATAKLVLAPKPNPSHSQPHFEPAFKPAPSQASVTIANPSEILFSNPILQPQSITIACLVFQNTSEYRKIPKIIKEYQTLSQNIRKTSSQDKYFLKLYSSHHIYEI